jgi:hypothetical protein
LKIRKERKKKGKPTATHRKFLLFWKFLNKFKKEKKKLTATKKKNLL